jgi:protease I
MRSDSLEGLRVAVLAADGFEQVELTSPVDALEDLGAEVDIVSLHPGRIRGVNHMYPGKKVKVDYTLDEIGVDDYDALLLPGGMINPDTLRQSDRVLDFVSAFNAQGKPIAMICHAPWVPISAGMVSGRRLTSWPGIKHDVLNAGGVWSDEAVVRDRNWVTSRGPHDLPEFNDAVAELFAELAPVRVEVEEEDGGGLGMLAAGIAAAAAGYAVWQYLQARSDRYEEASPAPLASTAPMPLRPEPVAEVERVVIVGDGVQH